MSTWSYINGQITVSPMGRTQAEKRYILETVLNHLPIVSGSERDMETYIIQKRGTNVSSSHDEYGNMTNNLIDRYGYHSRHDGWLRVQSEYIVVVNASLRDREFDETYRAFVKWLCRFAKRVSFENVLVKINDYYKSAIISDDRNPDSPFYKMNEDPSWCKESNGEPAWVEHLMWDRAKNSDYPILLEYKYYNNPENDAEAERRINYLKEKGANNE